MHTKLYCFRRNYIFPFRNHIFYYIRRSNTLSTKRVICSFFETIVSRLFNCRSMILGAGSFVFIYISKLMCIGIGLFVNYFCIIIWRSNENARIRCTVDKIYIVSIFRKREVIFLYLRVSLNIWQKRPLTNS